MAAFLFLALIILPISLGTVFIIFSRQLRSPTQLYLFIINMTAMIASALAASFSTSPHRLCFTWQPSVGEMCILFEKASLLLVLLVSISLLLIIIIHHCQTSVISSQQLGLALISISAANIAFLTEHFLLRYAALEVAGLCVVGASLAFSRSTKKVWDNTKLVFLNFRLGDIGLLAAILLFYAISDTFNISQNFNLSAQLPLTIRVALTIGLLSAVWTKMTIWPLDFWADLCSSLPLTMRTWLVDLLLPSLGAYLLYRTSPLLLSSNSISQWVVFFGCVSAFTKVFFTSINNHSVMLNRNPLIFSSVCLVLLAAFVDQKILWAFMIFWFFIRLLFLIVSIRREFMPTPKKTQYPSRFLASQLLLLGFSLIALRQAALPASISPALSVILWTTWWMHLIRVLKFNFNLENINPLRKYKGKIKEFLRSTLIGLLMAGISAASLTCIVFLLSLLVKGKGIWIISNQIDFAYYPFLTLNFWCSLAFAVFVLFILVDNPAKFKKYAKSLVNSIRIRKQPSLANESDSNADPLDFTANVSSLFLTVSTYVYKTIEHGSTSFFSKFFMATSTYLYENIEHGSTSFISKFFMATSTYIFENIEHGSVEKLIKVIQNIFNFLFTKIENFTSADLWLHALRSVIDSSYRVQHLHQGLLRANLVWLLLFIIVLVLIALSLNIGSIISIG